MPTLFSRIIAGELPGTFVWRDDLCVSFLSINPLCRGHALVVPIEEVDHWVDASPALNARLFEVAHVIAGAQNRAFAVRMPVVPRADTFPGVGRPCGPGVRSRA